MVMRIVVTEEQKKGISHKLMGMIDNNGLLNTIKFMGGYDNFITLLPDYFDSRESKIDLIKVTMVKVMSHRVLIFVDVYGNRVDSDHLRFVNEYFTHVLEPFGKPTVIPVE